MASTHDLSAFTPLLRPLHVTRIVDHRLMHLVDALTPTLVRLAKAPPSSRQGWAFRMALSNATGALGLVLGEETNGMDAYAVIGCSDPPVLEAIYEWLTGRWSTRASLLELMWRLDARPQAIAAADWAWQIGASDEMA